MRSQVLAKEIGKEITAAAKPETSEDWAKATEVLEKLKKEAGLKKTYKHFKVDVSFDTMSSVTAKVYLQVVNPISIGDNQAAFQKTVAEIKSEGDEIAAAVKKTMDGFKKEYPSIKIK